MKLFFLLVLSVLILESCGKKSDPQYQGKIKTEIKTIHKIYVSFQIFQREIIYRKYFCLNIAKKNKTPFYLYSEKQIKENYLNFAKILKM